MHSRCLNRARLSLRLSPVQPLLVRSGNPGDGLLHPEQPRLMFVRTERPGLGETVYLPGSSLKGVVRAAAERVLRSLAPQGQGERWACDPLGRSDCKDRWMKEGDELARKPGGPERLAPVHRGLCYACRLFGSTAAAARVLFADAYPPPEELARTNDTEVRNSVAIDRRSGGAAGNMLLDYEVVTAGAFDTDIHLTNYELWQLALLQVVLLDLHEGFVRIGGARTRGLGQVAVQVRALVVDQPARPGAAHLLGVGALVDEKVRRSYGLLEAEGEPLTGPPGSECGALGVRWNLKGAAARRMLEAVTGRPWQRLCESQREAA